MIKTRGSWMPWLAAIFLLQILSACNKDRTGTLAYVSNERDGTITVINTVTDTVVSTIKVGARPRGIHMTPDNRMVGVALSMPSNQKQGEDKIAFIDTASESIAAEYDAGTDPEQFVLNKD